MLGNIVLIILGIWGCYYTWTHRLSAGGSLFFDFASPTQHPAWYRFAVGLRLVIFGLSACVGLYRILFNITS